MRQNLAKHALCLPDAEFRGTVLLLNLFLAHPELLPAIVGAFGRNGIRQADPVSVARDVSACCSREVSCSWLPGQRGHDGHGIIHEVYDGYGFRIIAGSTIEN